MSTTFDHKGKQLTATSIPDAPAMASGFAIPTITQEIVRFEDSDGLEVREATLPVGKFKTLSLADLKALYNRATPVED